MFDNIINYELNSYAIQIISNRFSNNYPMFSYDIDRIKKIVENISSDLGLSKPIKDTIFLLVIIELLYRKINHKLSRSSFIVEVMKDTKIEYDYFKKLEELFNIIGKLTSIDTSQESVICIIAIIIVNTMEL